MTKAKDVLAELIRREEMEVAHGKGKSLRLKERDVYGNVDEKESFLQEICRYEKEGYLSISWLEAGNRISTVTLTKDEALIRKACSKELGRPFRRDVARNIADVLEKGISTIPCGIERDGLVSLFQIVEEKGKIPKQLFDDPGDDEKMVRAIAFLVKNERPTVVRMMSTELYRDSKLWERRIAKKTLSFLCTLNEQDKGQSFSDTELLALYNVGKYPEIFLFSGPLSWVDDLQHVHPGLSFPGALTSCCLDHTEHVMTDAKRIITVENMACYDYLSMRKPHDTLVLYHGGFLSSRRKAWIARILQSASPETAVSHWGDVDYGGFRMFLELRKICPRITPLLMDVQTLASHHEACMPTTSDYEKRLSSLAQLPEATLFQPVISVMLENHVRLEQESLLEDGMLSLGSIIG
jgi:hypothetical protein